MANALYRATVRELETLMPPRVVAQALHEGLAVLGKTPDTLEANDAATLLHNLIVPRLTRSLGDKQAQAAAKRILNTLEHVPADTPTISLKGQKQALELLQEALRPFNIYFEWGETQKLRAQLSLIESEHAADRDASELIAAAQTQLGVLQQKLSDQLSLQARELTMLTNALEASRALQNVKVRRLAQLLELIRSAQAAEQRVPAEIERAHKLASELRAEKLQRLSDETRELRGLRETYSTLLNLVPPLAERLSALETQLEAETLAQDALPDLRAELERTQESLRSALDEEFRTQLETAETPEFKQQLTLALKVLETTLPPATDVQQIRDLARSHHANPQLSEFHRLEAEAETYRLVPSEHGKALSAFLNRARGALGENRPLPDLSEGWQLIAQAQAEQTKSAESFLTRLEKLQTDAAPLVQLTSEDALALRWHLQSLGMQDEAVHRVSPKRQAEIESTLQAAEALVLKLQDEAQTAQMVAAQLIEGHTLDDLLGFLTPAAPAAPSASPQKRSAVGVFTRQQTDPRADLQRWLERQAQHAGIAGLVLFTESADTLVAGTLPSDPKTLQRTVRLTKRRADTLGTALGQGDATSLTLETPEHTLVALWLTKARSLVLVTRAPTWGGAARQHLEDALPDLMALLE